MINVSLENETDWIVKGTVTSDVSEINLEDDEFRIELKDLLEHYIKRKKSAEMVEAYQKDSTQTLSISNNEVKLVPLKCPICKGTGLAVDNYPMGRKPNGTSKYDSIYEEKNGVFENPITQLSDYINLPSVLFNETSTYQPYVNLDADTKRILTWDADRFGNNVLTVEGTNEYYYYTLADVTKSMWKRQKFTITKQYKNSIAELPYRIVDSTGKMGFAYYGYRGEKLFYIKNDPTTYYYYQKVANADNTYIRKSNCYYCQIGDNDYSSGEDPNAKTVCDDVPKPILTEEFYSNVTTYNNSDMKSLIENGFQFWISEDKKELYFRLTMRGQSSINKLGYVDKLKTELFKQGRYTPSRDEQNTEDLNDNNVYSRRVGFTLAICTISLDSTHRICFNITIAPTFKTSDIFRVDNDDDSISQIPKLPIKVCPICGDTHYQISYSAFEDNSIVFKHAKDCDCCVGTSGYYMDRYAYPYYNAKKFDDMIFLNNHSATYSSTYDTYWKKNKYVTSSTNDYDATRTNLYAAYTSAIIPNYLVNSSTIDVLSPTQADPHYSTKVRSFEYCYDEGVVSSYLLDTDKSRFCELPWDGNEITLNGFVYVEENGACIYDDLNVNLIRQDIDVGVVGETIDDMVGKTVFFGTEV